MVFLLTNDDGIDAPGLAALAEAATFLGEGVWTAPVEHHSGCSHRVTTDAPIRIFEQTPRRWAIAGTPADCVRLGLAYIEPGASWVLSGLNEGGNLGADVLHSGTVAAARESALHGVPAIALSHYRKRGRAIDWARAIVWMNSILRDLTAQTLKPGTFWNVNLPHLEPTDPDPAVVVCPVDPNPLPLSFRDEAGLWHYSGDYHNRARNPGTDVDVCFRGQISLTLMHVF